MLPSARALLATASLLVAALAGCVTPAAEVPASLPGADPITGLLPIRVENVMEFTQSIVSPAVGIFNDLYEPTMEVSDTGTIYVAGHVILAATTGTPAYFSTDDGATWEQLPFLGPLQAPSPVQGAQPPPGDEGFIVAGADGQAWMADIYAAGFSITGWCDDGATQCYDNRQAYDRGATATAPCDAVVSLNDRPWAAYGGGSLLLVNNPGGGPMQIGIMDVPPAAPVGIGGVNGPVWNLCASPGGWIPGIPAMREDGLFAVPQMSDMGSEDNTLTVTIGNKADIFAVENKEVFPVTSAGAGTSNGGRAAFDAEGTLYVGAKNNTQDEDGEVTGGQFILATSTDDGQTFRTATFATGTPVRSLYLDGNMAGPGALVVWSQLGETEGLSDWYVAHAFVGEDGAPVLRHVTLAVDEGPHSSAHVMGAAAGPDGRAYLLNFQSVPAGADPVSRAQAALAYVGTTPVSVWIQQEGERLPVVAPAAEPDA